MSSFYSYREIFSVWMIGTKYFSHAWKHKKNSPHNPTEAKSLFWVKENLDEEKKSWWREIVLIEKKAKIENRV